MPIDEYNVLFLLTLPACIDKDRCIFHLAEEGLVTKVLSFWCQGAGHHYKVTLSNKRVHGY